MCAKFETNLSSVYLSYCTHIIYMAGIMQFDHETMISPDPLDMGI